MRAMSRSQLAGALGKLPRQPLGTLPTPLHPLRRLSAELGGPSIWVKRDDLTGLALGGNKIRQLEYFVGAALAEGADVLIGGGSFAQSNHARACSAAARLAGLTPVIVVRPGGPPATGGDGQPLGNAVLTRLLCDDVRLVPELEQAPADRLSEVQARRSVFEGIADEYRARGHRPYVLTGTSVGLGAIGYVAAVLELQAQFDAVGLFPDWVVVTSIGVTQAGLEVGSRLLGLPWRVAGLAYRPVDGKGNATVCQLANEAAGALGADLVLSAEQVVNFDAMAGPDYGVASAASDAALRLAARTESLMLDPVYTAKGMATFIHLIRDGFFGASETVVFVHTGGLPALFAYPADRP